jgi:hypothetical protein
MVDAQVFILDAQGVPCASHKTSVFLSAYCAELVDQITVLVPPGTQVHRVGIDTGEWVTSVCLAKPAYFPTGGQFRLHRCHWRKPA